MGSGAAALGYQIVWVRQFSLALGHEVAGTLAVVAAFFAGLSIGAFVLDGRVGRSPRPGRWYVGLELVIAAWALLLVFLAGPLLDVAVRIIGADAAPLRHWTFAFGLPFVALLPATVAMGATLPAMERLAARRTGSARRIGALYACNTAGGVIGVLGTTFVLVPALGLWRSALVLAGISVACAVATAFGPARGEADLDDVHEPFDDAPSSPRLMLTLFMTGLLGIGFEVLGVRTIAQVMEGTVYTYAAVLAIFLVGTAIGAAIYQRVASKLQYEPVTVLLLQLLALTCAIGFALLRLVGDLHADLRAALPLGLTGAAIGESIVAATIFLLPTIVMGATFTHLVQAARGADGGVGRAVGVNTLGAALAPAVLGVLVMPAIGLAWTFVAIVVGYLLLLPMSALRAPRLLPAVAAIIVCMLVPKSLMLVEPVEGTEIIESREGATATTVVMAVNGQREQGCVLKVNNEFSMGGSRQSFADRRQAHLPLLLHEDPKRVLLLGLGAGLTAGAATVHEDLDVTAVELVPEVIEVQEWFSPANRWEDLREEVVIADARRFIRASDESWDVIIADLFHPGRDGAGALYTREHFAAIRERLIADGSFWQWLPLYQMDLQTFRLITRTFLSVFPEASLWIGHFNEHHPVIALAHNAQPTSDVALAQRMAANESLVGDLVEVALDRAIALLGCHVANADALEAFVGSGPINTDDHPRVIYDAPRFVYGFNEDGREQLSELMELSGSLSVDAALAERLAAYKAARNRYLEGRIRMVASESDGLDLILASVALSRDFRVAYSFCRATALQLAATNPAEARRILEGLVEAWPHDGRAYTDLRRIGADG